MLSLMYRELYVDMCLTNNKILIIIHAGIQVDYRGKIAEIEPGNALIRCLLLCWTGDHPAQCEVGKFLSSGGVHACRRDKLEGM